MGNVIYAACQWGILVVLAKLTSPEKVGLFALGLAITAPIFLFSQLQLRGVQATDARDEYQFGHYLGLRLLTTIIALGAVGVIVGIGGYERETTWIILAVALSKAFESVADVFYGLLQRHERMDRIARSLMIKGPLALCLLAVIVYTTGSVAIGVTGLAVAWGAVLIAYDFRNANRILDETSASGLSEMPVAVRPNFYLSQLVRLAWLAMPLGLTMALLSLKTNIPRYFIEHHLGAAQLGYFAALAYLMVATNTVVSAMGQTCVPRLSKYYAAGNNHAYKQLLLKLVAAGIAMGMAGVLGAIFFGSWVLTILYSPDYAAYSQIFSWLMLVNGFSIIASFLGYAMTAARHFKIQLPLFMLVILVTGIVAWQAIPRLGLIGGVFALAAGIGIQLILSVCVIVFALRDATVTPQKNQ
jgi:O-antigen/teichoic acid export membrane protein